VRPAARRGSRWLAAALLAATAAAAAPYLWTTAHVGAGFVAKMLCSGVFVSGREPEALLGHDLVVDGQWHAGLFDAALDAAQRRAEGRFLGGFRRRAVFRDGYGCTLEGGAPLPALPPPRVAAPDPQRAQRPWPEGERVAPAPGVDAAKLAAALQAAFAEPDPQRLRRTRAVVVVHDGRIVAERYAPGYTPASVFHGWSMAKSVMNALVGTLVAAGRIALAQPAALPEWSAAGDARAAISVEQLLRMTSGLAFSEDYVRPWSDVLRMLFASADAAGYAAARPLAHAPGARWAYSSGTSNVLARVLRLALADDAAYLEYPRRALFDPLGMTSALIELDAAGHFVASSFAYATARDWARFGLLYAQDGVWQGRRILPAGWVEYTMAPAPGSNGRYGAHFWLGPRPPGAPDALHAQGHDGQYVTVVPSRRAVIVRLGLARKRGAWDHAGFVSAVLDALPPR
jgi:CubicO group peptidase (beta-lactamase class C family)